MDQKQIIATASKILGLYFLVLLILELKNGLMVLFANLRSSNMGGREFEYLYFNLIQYGTHFIVYALVVWFLIYKSDQIANKISASGADTKLGIAISSVELLKIVVASIGLIMVTHSIPDILNHLAGFIYFNEYDGNSKMSFWDVKDRKTYLLFGIFKLAVGLIVITNAGSLSKKLMRIGAREENSQPEL
jgi:Ca2+/Na+ antiporter